ncbi:unnamed protein product [Schistocephalus solidus]|uniref:Uncharacterized protein n=1 Tax=Schistocephalus solidus TaxID=70667 RepID=A0A183TKS4_SCHSO|nr:unnamed protein product [Schistocephalus solidus]
MWQISINENSLQTTRSSSEAHIEELSPTERATQSEPAAEVPTLTTPQANGVEASLGEAPTSARQIIRQNPLAKGAVARSECIIV